VADGEGELEVGHQRVGGALVVDGQCDGRGVDRGEVVLGTLEGP
jgi:hypothetical protein